MCWKSSDKVTVVPRVRQTKAGRTRRAEQPRHGRPSVSAEQLSEP